MKNQPTSCGCPQFYSGDQYDAGASIGYALRNLALMMRGEIEARMARHGLTAAQWHPLLLLKLGKVSTALELARECGIDAGATSRMVDRLVAKGFVERVRSDSDRRVVHLGLSPAGMEVASLIPHELAGVQNDFLQGFTASELKSLQRLVARMLKTGEALRVARPQDAPPRLVDQDGARGSEEGAAPAGVTHPPPRA